MPKDSIMKLLVNIFILTLACTSVQCSERRDKFVFLQKSSGGDRETLVIVTWIESENDVFAGCEVVHDKNLIDEVLKNTESRITTITENQMEKLLKECTEINLERRETGEVRKSQENREVRKETQSAGRRRNTAQSRAESTKAMGYDGYPVIFPGTKWCGAGQTAEHYDDLGEQVEADKCCRAHDHCKDILAPGETRNGITNNSPFTKLSCTCDKEFYECLNRADTFTANTVGNMYFNVLSTECYEEDYPLTDQCKSYLTFLKLKCTDYERNTTAPKVMQWAQPQKYKILFFSG